MSPRILNERERELKSKPKDDGRVHLHSSNKSPDHQIIRCCGVVNAFADIRPEVSGLHFAVELAAVL